MTHGEVRSHPELRHPQTVLNGDQELPCRSVPCLLGEGQNDDELQAQIRQQTQALVHCRQVVNRPIWCNHFEWVGVKGEHAPAADRSVGLPSSCPRSASDVPNGHRRSCRYSAVTCKAGETEETRRTHALEIEDCSQHTAAVADHAAENTFLGRHRAVVEFEGDNGHELSIC